MTVTLSVGFSSPSSDDISFLVFVEISRTNPMSLIDGVSFMFKGKNSDTLSKSIDVGMLVGSKYIATIKNVMPSSGTTASGEEWTTNYI